jgi:hypothetical protein
VVNMLYMAYDGDDAGKLVGRAVLSDNVQELHNVSERISNGHEVVKSWVEQRGGQIISGGGDEGTFSIPAEALEEIEQLRADYQFATDLTMTVGIGKTLSEAGKSLMVGKFRGKNQAVQYEQGIEQELSQAQEHVASGSGTEEEKKISEAYLGDDCKYCKETEDHSDDCKYCAEHDAAQASNSDCQYCAEADAKAGQATDHDHTGDDCQYCQEAEAREASPDHEHTGDDCQYCQQAEQGALAQGVPNEESQEGTETSQTIPPQESSEASPAPTQEGQEDLETIASQIESDSPETQSEKGIVDQIDPSDINTDDNMESNASRPMETGTPEEMGLEQDQPNFGEVLQQGLDSQADGIQKERVIALVSQALQGFKASKDVLEQSKEQAPELYSAAISMLKAMIEMAKMLGLGGDAQAPAEQAIEQPAPGEENEWHDPFPQHPDHSAAGQGAAALAPQQ